MNVTHLEMTELDLMTPSTALLDSAGYDGAIFRTVVPLGTCNDLKDCAKAANKHCRQLGHGKAKTAKISLEGDSCSYTCTGGLQGEIVCAEKNKDSQAQLPQSKREARSLQERSRRSDRD